mmetsp:Transcript_19659/g.38068  ORF Transcript_19659/g.38068 Transcript_19659/m.38068 type:complete len:157 (-) Transcript_19659:116-586(-)
MVAIDGSPSSDDVLKYCAQNYCKRNDRITLVHTYTYSPVTDHPDFPLGVKTKEINKLYKDYAERKANDVMQAAEKKLDEFGCPRSRRKSIVVGGAETSAKQVLLGQVKVHHPDTLACGSRGMGAMGRAVLGSVSDYLVHNAACSVVVVKPSDAEWQ